MGLLAGCGEDHYKAGDKAATLNTGNVAEPIRVAAGWETVNGTGGAPSNVAEALGSVGTPAHSESEKNRVTKADFYFKLDWARQVLDRHSVPPELRTTVDQGRTALRGISGERGVAPLLEAMSLYDQAIDLYEEQERLQRASSLDDTAAYAGVQKSGSAFSEDGDGAPARPASRAAAKSGPATPDDPWPIFRSAGLKVQEAGRRMGLTKERSAAFNHDPFKGDPFESDPFQGR